MQGCAYQLSFDNVKKEISWDALLMIRIFFIMTFDTNSPKEEKKWLSLWSEKSLFNQRSFYLKFSGRSQNFLEMFDQLHWMQCDKYDIFWKRWIWLLQYSWDRDNPSEVLKADQIDILVHRMNPARCPSIIYDISASLHWHFCVFKDHTLILRRLVTMVVNCKTVNKAVNKHQNIFMAREV